MHPPSSASADTADAPTISVSLRGKAHKVALPATVGALRAAIEAQTSVPTATQVLLCRGKKMTAAIPDDTPVADFQLRAGTKVMLQIVPPPGSGGPDGGGLHVPERVAKVRAIDKEVAKIEGELTDFVARIEKLRLGFLDVEKTATGADRIRQECDVVAEKLMQKLEAADELTASASTEQGKAHFRAERKAVVVRVQAALRRCNDDVYERLKEVLEDTHDEMKHRRGNPT